MTEFLSIILYILGSILLIVLIILGIKLIIMMDKLNVTVDNINTKINSLNGFFHVIDFTTDKLAMISDKVSGTITDLIKKLFNKNKKEEEKEND